MSSHYEFSIACLLKHDTPKQVISTLLYLTRHTEYTFDDLPDHELFEDFDVSNLLRNRGMVAGFPGIMYSDLVYGYQYTRDGQATYQYNLCFRQVMHDDTFYHVWWQLAGWLAPYSDTVGYVGWYREQTWWYPTLIYFRDAKVYAYEVTQPPLHIWDNHPWKESK